MKKYFSTFILLANFFCVSGQNIDSLKLIVKTAKGDTNNVNALIALAKKLNETGKFKDSNEQTDAALVLAKKLGFKKGIANAHLITGNIYTHQGNYPGALKEDSLAMKLFKETGDKIGMSGCHLNMGVIYGNQGDMAKSLNEFLACLSLRKEIGDKKAIASCRLRLGNLYSGQGKYPEALKEYFEALKLAETLGDKKSIGYAHLNIGTIYSSQKNYPEALKKYVMALKMFEEIGDKFGAAFAHGNIGVMYKYQKKFPEALKEYFAALKVFEEAGDKKNIASSHLNIGIIYKNQGDYPRALEEYMAALKIQEEIGDKFGMTNTTNNTGALYIYLNQAAKGKEQLLKGLEMAKEIGNKDEIMVSYCMLSQADSVLGQYKSAWANYKSFIIYRDSMLNEQNTKKTVETQMNFEFAKKQAADSVKVVEEKKLTDLKFTEEKKQRYYLYAGLLLVIVFAVFMVNRFRITSKQKKIIELKEKETQKQNEIISLQKHLVEEKHKEITDSINYAERIQRSFLATKELLDEHLYSPQGGNGYFVFFQPKDVVSGDFYWIGKLNNGNFALATADSTGHGVPGAIMSLLNITSLEKSIEKETDSSSILNATRKIIIERLKKDGSTEGGKDGMDCSLIIFNKEKTMLQCSAASNPVWIIRNNEIIEIKPDRFPVGKHEKDKESFTLQEVNLEKNDMVYCLTDGYADQFGGPKGKKFKYKALQDLLLSLSCEAMEDQHQKLKTVFDEWKGDLEQVDDVTIIGIRI